MRPEEDVTAVIRLPLSWHRSIRYWLSLNAGGSVGFANTQIATMPTAAAANAQTARAVHFFIARRSSHGARESATTRQVDCTARPPTAALDSPAAEGGQAQSFPAPASSSCR